MKSGDEVCWNVVFGTLVGVSVFSAISCPQWPLVDECQSEE